MSTIAVPRVRANFGANRTLPLENGDRLKAAEFERRYDAMPNLKKAELIRGVVYMGSPVRVEFHGIPHSDLMGWLAIYRFSTPHVFVGDNSTMRLDDDNQPQPDGCLFIDSAHGGHSQIVNGYLTGAPELVVEVSSSTVSYDLHQKKDVYAEFGVREYLVWRVLDGELDWWTLKDGVYMPLPSDAEGILRSEIFPGLWLAAAALVEGKMSQVQAVLNRGLADPSHAEFADRLRGGS
ncbi:MAG TPA: Uma2 family endonuclease [Gemmataceae bacterium]|jgi:Uma2 family endonuclease|nr:Uma2 family endonuclease [Gemmataceae bacterium]